MTGGGLFSRAPGSVGSRAVQAGRLAAAAGWRGWCLARLIGDDQVPVADRAVSHVQVHPGIGCPMGYTLGAAHSDDPGVSHPVAVPATAFPRPPCPATANWSTSAVSSARRTRWRPPGIGLLDRLRHRRPRPPGKRCGGVNEHRYPRPGRRHCPRDPVAAQLKGRRGQRGGPARSGDEQPSDRARCARPGQPTRSAGVCAFVARGGQKPGQRVRRYHVPLVGGSLEHGVHDLGSQTRRTGATLHVQADQIAVPGSQTHHPHPVGRGHLHSHLPQHAAHLLPLTLGPGPGVDAPAPSLCMPPTAHPRK